jgi:hypothetical protein
VYRAPRRRRERGSHPPLGDVALAVEDDRLIVAVLGGLVSREDAVDVGPSGLGRRRDRVVAVLPPGGDARVDPLLQGGFPESQGTNDTKRSRDEFAVALREIPRYESVRAVTTSADLWKLRPAFSMHMAFWRSS